MKGNGNFFVIIGFRNMNKHLNRPFIFKFENYFSSGLTMRWDLLFRIPEKLKINFVSKNGVGGSSYYATLTSYEVNCRPLFSCCLTSFFVLLLSIYDSKKVSLQPLTIFMTTHFLLQHTLIYTFSHKNDDEMMFSFNIWEYR